MKITFLCCEEERVENVTVIVLQTVFFLQSALLSLAPVMFVQFFVLIITCVAGRLLVCW